LVKGVGECIVLVFEEVNYKILCEILYEDEDRIVTRMGLGIKCVRVLR